MEGLIGKVIDVLLNNPLTVTLVLSGVVCVFIAIIGEIPKVQAQKPISGSRAVVLGSFGILLIFTAIGLSWILASSSSANKPTTVVVVTATPFSSANQSNTITPIAISQLASPVPTQNTAKTSIPTVALPLSSPVPSCDATPHVTLPQGDHFFPGAIHIAELWRSNGQTPWGDKLVRAIVHGDISVVAAGGSIWTYPAGCDTLVQVDVTNNPRATVITEEQMREAGIIK